MRKDILKAMKANNYTRKILAEDLNIDYTTLNAIINNKRTISVSVAFMLEKVLGMNMEQILINQLKKKIGDYKNGMARIKKE